MVSAGRVDVEFVTKQEAAAFYGVGHAVFYRWVKDGVECGDPLPYGEPDKMPGWFERQRAAGRRKHRVPESVMQRAAGVGLPLFEGQKAEAGMKPMEMDGEMDGDDVLAAYRAMASSASVRMKEAAKDGNEVEMAKWGAMFDRAGEKMRQWSKDIARIREQDAAWVRVDEVRGEAEEAFRRLWRALRREIEAAMPGSETALDAVAGRIGEFLPEALRAA